MAVTVAKRTIAGGTVPGTVIEYWSREETGAGGYLITTKKGEVRADSAGDYSFDLDVLTEGAVRYQFRISPSRKLRDVFLAAGAAISIDELLRAAGQGASSAVEIYLKENAVLFTVAQTLSQGEQDQARRNLGGRPMIVSVPDPTASDDIHLGRMPFDISIQRIVSVLVGSGGQSLTWSLRYSPDRSAPGTEVVGGGIVTNSTTLGIETVSLDNPDIPADSYLKLVTTQKTGVVTELGLTIYYI